MNAATPTFLILDGNALLHRAWHAIPPLATQDGRVVNAVYGFAMIVEKMRTELHPDFMAVAWDLPGGTFRHEEYEAYKGTREKKAQELYDQIPMIQRLMDAYGIPSFTASGFEADDILGTVSALNAKDGIQTLIVTGDLDSLQLVDDSTEVVFFVKGLSQTKRYDITAVKERYGLLPKELIDYKALVGDSSDNLPGIAGVGEKTALSLLTEHHTLEGIFAALHDNRLPEKVAKKFAGQEAVAAQMKRLVTIVRDVPMALDRSKAVLRDPDAAVLCPVLRDFEFKTLLKKYEERSAPAPSTKPRASLQSCALRDLEDDRIGVLLVEKAQDLFGGRIQTIVVTDGKKTYVKNDPDAADIAAIVATLSRAKQFIAHDIKAALHHIAAMGVDVTPLLPVPMFDTYVAMYLLSSGDREFDFHEGVRIHLGATIAGDADGATTIGALLPLAASLTRKLEDEGMLNLATTIEMPLIPVLFRMERHGFAVDVAQLTSLSAAFDARLQELTSAIYADAGRELNINSPSQLAEVLFDTLGLPTKGVKKTKSGFSTAAPELEKLVDAHPIIAKISEYRELAKLKGTYADTLPKLVDTTGKIHARFNQCVAATGRLSSSDPNLQNIPIRSELGRDIRRAFVAQEGHVLLSADYSQIELRLAAHIAKDASFLHAFRDGADIHRRTAAEMWGIDEESVTKAQRYAAKAINFGILYGIGPRALARSAGVTFDEAKEFIARYFVAHPGIAEYLDATKLQAHANGFVTTLFGRRRYLPEMHSGMPQLVAAGERMAINMPIQGTQADIIKKAMITIDAWLQSSGIDAAMIAQVHDELVFDVAKSDVDVLSQGIRERMATVIDLDVPLVVDIDVADSWGDME